jgi:hypothetical protein
MTTLHDVGGALGRPLDTSFGLSRCHGHGTWLVCEVTLSFGPSVAALGSCMTWALFKSTLCHLLMPRPRPRSFFFDCHLCAYVLFEGMSPDRRGRRLRGALGFPPLRLHSLCFPSFVRFQGVTKQVSKVMRERKREREKERA